MLEPSQKPGQSFSVTTYNILADSYIKRDWYPFTPDECLDPQTRRKALIAHLIRLDTDALCLQEVESTAYEAIESSLSPLGYMGFYAQKGEGKPDGCATFLKHSAFSLTRIERLEYRDAHLGSRPSGHIAQLLCLEHEGGKLGIANTHLKWDPPDTPKNQQYGYLQASQIIQEREDFLPGCRTWIICGDLNATPESALISHIQESGFRSTHKESSEVYTANNNRQAKTIDYLFFDSSLKAQPLPLPSISAQTPLPGPDQPSDHIAVTAHFTWA